MSSACRRDPVYSTRIDLVNDDLDINYERLLDGYKDISNVCSGNFDISDSEGGTTINNFLEDLITMSTHVKEKNREKARNIQNTLGEIQRSTNSETRDYDNLLENTSMLDQITNMNKDQMKIFVEKYFYLIVKVIFILFIFYLLYNRSSFVVTLSLGSIFGGLVDKAKGAISSSSGFVKNIGQKIGDLEKKEKMKDRTKPQSNQGVAKPTNASKSGIQSSNTGIGSSNPKFGTNPIQKDIYTQSLDRV